MRSYLVNWLSNFSVGLIVGSTIALLIDHKISVEAAIVFSAGLVCAVIGFAISARK